LFAQQ
jgi:hypothetical protein